MQTIRFIPYTGETGDLTTLLGLMAIGFAGGVIVGTAIVLQKLRLARQEAVN